VVADRLSACSRAWCYSLAQPHTSSKNLSAFHRRRSGERSGCLGLQRLPIPSTHGLSYLHFWARRTNASTLRQRIKTSRFFADFGVQRDEGRRARMSHDTEISNVQETVPTRSAAAERMRAHRERRRLGLRSVVIQIREREIDVLIRRGLLKADARNNVRAIGDAIHAHLDESLGT
jgi:hypothetical protein